MSIFKHVAVALLMLMQVASLTAQNRAATLGAETPANAKFPETFTRPVPPPGLAHRLPLLSEANAFPSIVFAAGMIFSGEVTSITHTPATDDKTVATVAVTFHVLNAVRGAAAGQDLTITEWSGLWNSGQRYRVGNRLMLFLYPPSKLGLTSCVAGPLGRFVVDGAGHVQLSGLHTSAFRGEPMLAGKSWLSSGDFLRAIQRTTVKISSR